VRWHELSLRPSSPSTPTTSSRPSPAFALLPECSRPLAGSFDEVDLPFRATIVEEGDEADAFYVASSPSARRVLKRAPNGKEVAQHAPPRRHLRRGGLLEHTTRTATVRASSE
jgi:hypothetical protein